MNTMAENCERAQLRNASTFQIENINRRAIRETELKGKCKIEIALKLNRNLISIIFFFRKMLLLLLLSKRDKSFFFTRYSVQTNETKAFRYASNVFVAFSASSSWKICAHWVFITKLNESKRKTIGNICDIDLKILA